MNNKTIEDIRDEFFEAASRSPYRGYIDTHTAIKIIEMMRDLTINWAADESKKQSDRDVILLGKNISELQF